MFLSSSPPFIKLRFARSVDVTHLMLKDFFRGTDVSDAGEDLLEKHAVLWFPKPLTIHGDAFGEVILEQAGVPIPELGNHTPLFFFRISLWSFYF